MNIRTIIFILTAICCLGTTALADVPHLINFQGTLTDTTGSPITDTRNIQFALYADSTGGASLWSESHSAVDVIDGLFRVMLGSATSFPSNLFDGSKLWLGITVSPDITELTPRQPLVTTPYAYMTEEADHAMNADTAAFALASNPDYDWTISGSNIYRNTGKVGIGTATPTNKLHIFGSENIPLLNVEQNGWGRALRIYSHNVCGIWVEHAGNHGVRITNAVGDGIHVENAHNNGIYVNSADGWAGYFNGDGYFGGDVGIGTSSPSVKLDVNGTVKMTGFHLNSGTDGVRARSRDEPDEGYVLTSDAQGIGTWQAAPGDISSVTAGGGLTGGGTEGDVTLDVQTPLVITDSTANQAAIKGINNHSYGTGIEGISDDSYGRLGTGGIGVLGSTSSGTAVRGQYSQGDVISVANIATPNYGVEAIYEDIDHNNFGYLGHRNYAVHGFSTSEGTEGYIGGDSIAVYGSTTLTDDYAGYFDGKTKVDGEITVGEDGSGHDVNFYGDNYNGRLYWNQEKSALRIGWGSGNWHPDSIGLYSFSSGINSKASGSGSVATGSYSNASGNLSLAMGDMCTASGENSTAIGYWNTASNHYSLAMGALTTASGWNSFAVGNGTTASGESATALGAQTRASGYHSTAMGQSTTASGFHSTAMGEETVADGTASTAMGSSSEATGDYSFASGRYVTADTNNSMVLGQGVSFSSRLINDVPNSLMVGFNTTSPTLFVGGPDQRVGIGTSSPGAKLHLNSSESETAIRLNCGASWTAKILQTNTSLFQIVNGGSTRLTIKSNGNVGIGNTDPAAPLVVQGTEDTDVALFNVNGDRFSFVVHSSGPDYMTIRTKTENPGLDIISFLGSGRVGIGTTTPSEKLDVEGDIECTALHETSDDRLKTNVQTLDNALDNITKLRGVSFEWNEEAKSVGATSGEKQIGVLASEVEQVFPELVSNPETGYKSVDYTKLTAVLIEAVKELKTENTVLKEDINRLKNDITVLKAALGN